MAEETKKEQDQTKINTEPKSEITLYFFSIIKDFINGSKYKHYNQQLQ